MVTLRKRTGKWTAEIRRRGHRKIYRTFVHKSGARRFVNKVESDITQKSIKIYQRQRLQHLKLRYIDISEKK